MIVKKGNKMIKFIKQKCGKGSFCGFELQNKKQAAYVARVQEEETQRIHELFCHTNMQQAKEAAERLGMNINDVWDLIVLTLQKITPFHACSLAFYQNPIFLSCIWCLHLTRINAQ